MRHPDEYERLHEPTDEEDREAAEEAYEEELEAYETYWRQEREAHLEPTPRELRSPLRRLRLWLFPNLHDGSDVWDYVLSPALVFVCVVLGALYFLGAF